MLTDATLGLALALSLAAALVSIPAVRAELRPPAVVRLGELPPPSDPGSTVALPDLAGTAVWSLP